MGGEEEGCKRRRKGEKEENGVEGREGSEAFQVLLLAFVGASVEPSATACCANP